MKQFHTILKFKVEKFLMKVLLVWC